jgi:hypothetical protein
LIICTCVTNSKWKTLREHTQALSIFSSSIHFSSEFLPVVCCSSLLVYQLLLCITHIYL